MADYILNIPNLYTTFDHFFNSFDVAKPLHLKYCCWIT